jgi:hypothetical protein
MPRTETGPDISIEYLSILNETGKVDEELMPQFTNDHLLKGYKMMLMARRFDETRLKMQRTGRIGTFAPVNGQEAAQIGTISTIREDDMRLRCLMDRAAKLLPAFRRRIPQPQGAGSTRCRTGCAHTLFRAREILSANCEVDDKQRILMGTSHTDNWCLSLPGSAPLEL